MPSCRSPHANGSVHASAQITAHTPKTLIRAPSTSRSLLRSAAALEPASATTAGTAANVSHNQTTPGSSSLSRSEEHTSELQSLAYLVCRLLLEKKKKKNKK